MNGYQLEYLEMLIHLLVQTLHMIRNLIEYRIVCGTIVLYDYTILD